MRQVTLRSLTLCNFKGEKSRTTEFGALATTIAGANGMGKSRHFDAFVWLLFGKDRMDRKDYEVKSRIDGEELHRAECSVEGVISVDGEDVTLKRAFTEEWVKPRGQIDEVFRGNRTECWWNGAPVSVTEYDRRVAAVIDPSVFKMLTNPRYFAAMPWKLQREQLLMLAGTVSDAEVAQGDPDFRALLDRLSGKSFADFRAEAAAAKKRLKAEQAQVRPRIDQTLRMRPEDEDSAQVEKGLASVEARIVEADALIERAASEARRSGMAAEARESRIRVMEREAQELLFRARNEARERAFEESSRRRELETGAKSAERAAASKVMELERLREAQEGARRDEKEITASLGKLRAEWQEVNASEYDGAAVCPACGQPLPAERIEEARRLFNETRRGRLDGISQRGAVLNERLAASRKRAESAEAMIAAAEAALADFRESQRAYEEALADLPAPAAPAEIIPAEVPGWTELQARIAEEKAAAPKDEGDRVPAELRERRRVLQEEKDALVARLARQDLARRCDDEVAALEKRGRELAQQIADIEREEYIAARFTKRKIDECERRINSMFTRVSFRLFDYTQEGNEVETCVPLVDGVPYGSANSAGQLNAGLDIINTLCRFYGITAPIFIDNAEGVNDYLPTLSQMIYLRVTRDKELVVTKD